MSSDDDWKPYDPKEGLEGPYWLLISTPRRAFQAVSLAWFVQTQDAGLRIIPIPVVKESVVPFVEGEDRILMVQPYTNETTEIPNDRRTH